VLDLTERKRAEYLATGFESSPIAYPSSDQITGFSA